MRLPKVGDRVLCVAGEGEITKVDQQRGEIWFRVSDMEFPIFTVNMQWREEASAWVLV